MPLITVYGEPSSFLLLVALRWNLATVCHLFLLKCLASVLLNTLVACGTLCLYTVLFRILSCPLLYFQES